MLYLYVKFYTLKSILITIILGTLILQNFIQIKIIYIHNQGFPPPKNIIKNNISNTVALDEHFKHFHW